MNSSASHRAISSDASGYIITVSNCLLHETFSLLTLDSLGLKSIKSVSSTTFVVSTSSPSLLKLLMRFLKAPDATDAGYSFAKLLKPNIDALLSSSSVALCNRPLKVDIVSSAFCFAGA